jgi:transcriptional regulator with XRE-family HTH domain
MAESSQTHQYLQEVGRRIKALRKERGFTLADLGENIGLDKSNTHRLEQGKNFTLLTLVKIAAFLDVHPKDILAVPFNTHFTHIEKVIAEKKNARKPSSAKQGKQNESQTRKSTRANRLYELKKQATSIAAEKGKSIKRK